MYPKTGIKNSPTKISQHIHNSMSTIRYRFICHKQVAFGQAVYIVGNIEQLGEWQVSCAVRLDCYISDFWIVDIDVPIDTQIEYKYFVSSYEHHFSIKNLQIQEKNWIGTPFDGANFRLFLGKRDQAKILETKKTKNLKIMSFNIRYENSNDRDEFNWINRRQNVIFSFIKCVQIIKQHYPSIIGVQQAKQSQRSYLQYNLCQLYNYVGIARDCKKDEQVGIFYDKQRFIVVQQGFRWISQSQAPGSVGFGASFPRYFTFLILEDTYISEKFENSLKQSAQQIPTWIPQNLLMVVNVHLDHLSALAQQKGVELISKEVENKYVEYKDRLKDVFIFGDFNTSYKNSIFKKFHQSKPRIQSIRDYFEHKNQKDFCDYGYTFNGFVQKNTDIIQKLPCTIDHMFVHNSVYKPSEFLVIREMIHQPKNSKYTIVSDHFPILGIFKPIIKQE